MPAWTAFFWGDYLRDTQDLDLLAHGAYFRLLAHYYSTEEALPKQPHRLYRICGAFSKAEQTAVNEVVDRYFHDAADGKRHKRADAEIAHRKEIARIKSEAGKKGGRPKKRPPNVSEFPSK